MAAILRCLAVGGLALAIAMGAMGCNGTAAAKGTSQPRNARLLEEENYRLSEQIKGLEKQVETLKAEAAATLKERTAQEEAAGNSLKFLMDLNTEKDTENKKLQDKVAELEKELASLKGK